MIDFVIELELCRATELVCEISLLFASCFSIGSNRKAFVKKPDSVNALHKRCRQADVRGLFSCLEI
jgi:hypothetical protein